MSIHNMFSCRNKKNINNFWLKISTLSGAVQKLPPFEKYWQNIKVHVYLFTFIK